jgi:hypothetical protein
MSTIAPAAAWQRHRRLALAKGLERVVAEAGRPYVRSAAVPFDRRAVRESRDSLLELAASVREVDHARSADLLLVRRLLVDTDGPLYCPASPAQLREAADFAREELEVAR